MARSYSSIKAPMGPGRKVGVKAASQCTMKSLAPVLVWERWGSALSAT